MPAALLAPRPRKLWRDLLSQLHRLLPVTFVNQVLAVLLLRTPRLPLRGPRLLCSHVHPEHPAAYQASLGL